MTPQERDLITDLFRRLGTVAEGEIDTEARSFIERLVAERPQSLYVLTQTALVQEHALKGAQIRIAELEGKLAEPRPAPSEPKRSFLSGLIGNEPSLPAAPPANPWAKQSMAAPPTAYVPPPPGSPQAMPWGSAPSVPQAPSFLKSAVAAAAGVAGGALLYQGISSMLGHGGSPFAQAGLGGGKPAEQTVVNNYYDQRTTPAGPIDTSLRHVDDNDTSFKDAAFVDDGASSLGGDEESV